MKMKTEVLLIFVLAAVLLASTLRISATTSAVEYNPWYDLDGDGKITIYDVVKVTGIYGSSGEPFAALAAIEYDSGWIDITDKCGVYFNITHNLNGTDIIVDITGKITLEDGVHQRNLGGTGYTPGWSRTYARETYNNEAKSLVQTNDGGYAIAGWTDISGHSDWRFLLVKMDSDGDVQWSKTYGEPAGSSACQADSVIQTSDGGYAIAGWTYGNDMCMWLVKTDSAGNMIWNKTYGGTADDYAMSVVQTGDGGYAIAGYTKSFGVSYDFWLVKTNSTGNMLWSRTYGGADDDYARSVIQTSDGGYIIAGQTGLYADSKNRVVKTDINGNMQWDNTYSGGYHDELSSVVQTSDDGYALAGSIYVYEHGRWNNDFWLVKIDANGNMQWDKSFGGANHEHAYDMIQASDGGYTLTGDTGYGSGNWDYWLVKTDAEGNMQWNQTYGIASPNANDGAFSLVQTCDGGYAMAGSTWTYFGDYWAKPKACLIKTEVESGLAWTSSTANTITLYRGVTDPYWNYVRVRIWKIKETP